MFTKKQKIIYGSLGGVAAIAIVASLSLGGGLFKGFLLQPLTQPDYVSCAFQQGNNVTKISCPKITVQQLQTMAEGSYNFLVEYSNKNLGDQGHSVVPIKVISTNGIKDFVCEYADQGYVPEVSIAGTSALDSDKILTKGQKITMGTLTQNLKINMKKDGKTYPYDVNICGANLTGTVKKDGQVLGNVQYGLNGLINKSGINQIAIAPKSLYYMKGSATQKPNIPGDYELTLDGFNSASFIFSVPCSTAQTNVKIEDTESDSSADSALIPTTGLTDDYIKQCGSKLYMSIHNTQDVNDFHTLSANLSKIGTDYALIPNMFDLKNILSGKGVSFPMTYTTYLHEKDGTDASEIKNLAQFTWTITGTNASDLLPAAASSGSADLNATDAPADPSEAIPPSELGAPDPSQIPADATSPTAAAAAVAPANPTFAPTLSNGIDNQAPATDPTGHEAAIPTKATPASDTQSAPAADAPAAETGVKRDATPAA